MTFLEILLGVLCVCFFAAAMGIYLSSQHRKRALKTRFAHEIHHLNHSLREAEQHKDALTHQLQQRDQKIENLQLTVTELTGENASKAAELSFLKDIQENFAQQREKVDELLKDNSYLKATLQQEQTQAAEKLRLLQNAEDKLQTQFKALSSEIFAQSNKSFLDLANSTLRAAMEKSSLDMANSLEKKEQAIQTLVQPIQTALGQVDLKIQALEKERVGAYETLKTQVHHLISGQKELRFETANLVKALRTPQVRGKWGEMQLRRVVEVAGMTSHCDFIEQSSAIDSDSGARMRPDMIIHLPGNNKIIVDAKAPLMAYLEALDMTDENLRLQKLQEHAKHVRAHIKALSQRSYFEQFEQSPDFVVLFLPGEMFFSAALEQDPELLELGFKDKVILATPTTLIALLRAVAYGWRHESLAENAKAISKLGQELSKRVSDLANHMVRLGKNIGHVVDSYNQTVGTLERRVLVSARKFKDFDTHAEDISDVPSLAHMPRQIQALELLEKSSNNKDLSFEENASHDDAHNDVISNATTKAA